MTPSVPGAAVRVRPGGGALCCLRLNPNLFDAAGVSRFWAVLPEAELQIGNGAWFGESSAVLRLGFGYLPLDVLPAALDALARAIAAASASMTDPSPRSSAQRTRTAYPSRTPIR